MASRTEFYGSVVLVRVALTVMFFVKDQGEDIRIGI